MDDHNLIDEEQTKCGLPALSTEGGKSEIMLYADASFCHEAKVGSWAFRAPGLNLERVGSAPGQRVTRLEFLAVLHGLEAVVATDNSDLPIHVLTDCESSAALITALVAGRPLKRPQRYADREDLFPRLQSVMSQRRIHATKYLGGSLDHQACHRNAHRRLREELDTNPGMLHEIALIRQRSRLDTLIREREPLLDRLAKVDEEIVLLQTQIDALKSTINLGDVHQKEKL